MLHRLSRSSVCALQTQSVVTRVFGVGLSAASSACSKRHCSSLTMPLKINRRLKMHTVSCVRATGDKMFSSSVDSSKTYLAHPSLRSPDHSVPPVSIMHRVAGHGNEPFMRDGQCIYTYTDLCRESVKLSNVLQTVVDTIHSAQAHQTTVDVCFDHTANTAVANSESTSALPPRVAFLIASSFDYSVAMMSVWNTKADHLGFPNSGCVSVPLHIDHPLHELEYIVRDSGAQVLVLSSGPRPHSSVSATDHNNIRAKGEELARLCGMQVVFIDESSPSHKLGVDVSVDDVFAPSQAPLMSDHIGVDALLSATTTVVDAGHTQSGTVSLALHAPSLSCPALFIYTSGTTGKPKAVVISHGSLHSQITSQVQAWEWTAADHILNVLPLHHVHGVVNVYLTAMWVGARLTTIKFDPEAVWKLFTDGVNADIEPRSEGYVFPAALEHEGNNYEAPLLDAQSYMPSSKPSAFTLFMAVPTVYAKLIDEYDQPKHTKREENLRGQHNWGNLSKEEYDAGMAALGAPDVPLRHARKLACGQFRMMVSGSMALPATVMQKWRHVSGHSLLERYGMTEVGMALTNPYRGVRKEGTVGRPFAGMEVLIDCSDGHEEGANADAHTQEFVQGPGELLVRGPSVFAEYFNKKTATQESFIESVHPYQLTNASAWYPHLNTSWFKTGDVAAIDADGYVHLLGRASVDILKISGYKVSALDVERELLCHPGIKEVAVVGLPNETYGQTMCAIVVLHAGESLSLDSLRQWCQDKLAAYKIPRAMWVCPSIPRNAMGKINKKHLVTLIPKDITNA